jgi:NAD(P)-dependent dehydrogenase (short-subunit alcohol dehydrogenase family)
MNEHPKRVALVSGGANGIGAGIAARLSQDGWRVVVADRDSAGAAPPRGRYVVCDVADEAAVSSLLHSVGATERRLDALICNAGFMIRKPIANLSLSEWSSVLATNLYWSVPPRHCFVRPKVRL